MPPVKGAKYRKPKDTKATAKRLIGYLGEYKFLLSLVVVFILISSLANVAGTAMLRPLIDDYILPVVGAENPDLTGFIRIIVTMSVVYVLGVLAGYAYSRIMVSISQGVLCRIRVNLFNHMQELPVEYFAKHPHGELMSLYTNDTDAMREMLSQSIPQVINSTVRLVSIFIMMILLSPGLTILTIFMLIIMLFIVTRMAKVSGKQFKVRQASLAAVNGYMEEMIEGQKVVKVFCHERVIGERFSELNEDLRISAAKANAWANALMPMMGNLSYAHFAITAMAGALLVVVSGGDSGFGAVFGITLGTLASFLQYTRNFSQPITMLSQQFNAILSALAGAERIFSLMDVTPEEDSGNVTLVRAIKDEQGNIKETDEHTGMWAWKRVSDDAVSYVELRGDVRLNDVTFSYDGEVDVLKHISLYAKPGQKIAFVGSTGAGKTTITNLINRFYEVSRGTITYDGIDIKDIKKSALRRSLAMVLQDTHLFTGTVMDNIRYGRLDATDEEVIAAAKLANAHYFISRLPQGYDTMLTADGSNLSQGQRQLLSIARVAVADPPVLILDEATSSIDTRTEALIERGMDQLMAGRTVFIIAHRLSTVRNSNAIMVLEHGEIIERGDHNDLLEQQGRYYQLYMGKFELE